MKNIGIYTGYWSTNIGNSFFQLGAEYILKKAFPNANIFPIADEPGYLNPRKGNPINAYNPLLHQSLDLIVILGPFLRPESGKIILSTFQYFKRKGIRILAMGVGMMEYSKATISQNIEILKELNIELLITRDKETYQAFKKISKNIFNGIDLGFFSSELYTGTGVDGEYITLNFDQLPEPSINLGLDKKADHQFQIDEKPFSLTFNKFKKRIYEKGTIYQIIDRTFFPQFYNRKIEQYDIIRTEHRYNPALLKKIYSLPNTFSGDIPHPYWAIYKNSKLTISNRVHACVATLSFGNPAWLFTKSPRSYLLDRVGATTIKNRPTTIDLNKLAQEKEDLIQFIRKSISL